MKASLVTLASLGLCPKHFSSSCTLTKILKLKNPILQIGSFKNKKRWKRRHANCLKRAATGGSWAKMGGYHWGIELLTVFWHLEEQMLWPSSFWFLVLFLGTEESSSWSVFWGLEAVQSSWMCPVKYFPPSLSLKVLFGAGYLHVQLRQTQCSVWWIGLQVMGTSREISCSTLKSWVY